MTFDEIFVVSKIACMLAFYKEMLVPVTVTFISTTVVFLGIIWITCELVDKLLNLSTVQLSKQLLKSAQNLWVRK